MSWRLGDRPLRRILVTRLRYLGDVVMSTVVIEALRSGDPRLEIGYLCEEAYAPVLAGHPDLARVHALAVRRRGADARARRPGSARKMVHAAATGAGVSPAVGAAAQVLELRRHRYDAAVDLFFNPRSAWLLRLAGMPARLAGPAGSRSRLYTHLTDARPARRDPRWDTLAPGGLGDHLARLGPLTHVETGLGFSEWFATRGERALPRLACRPLAPARAVSLLAQVRLESESGYLVLAPAATWETKRWPVEQWRDLAAALARTWAGPIVVLTAPGDEQVSAAIVASLPDGRGAALPVLPLTVVLDVVAAAAGLVTVDGGVMHAAVGLGTPVLALFGPTDPRIWFPYEGAGPFAVLAQRPPCHPCDRHACDAFVCLPELTVATVAARALALFGNGDAS